MGAFREFFEGLFKPISDPIAKIKNELIGPEGFLVKVKAKILSIDDVFDKHVTGPLVEAIGNIGGLPAKLLVSIESLISFLDGQKDNVVDFFTGFLDYIEARRYQFWMLWMQKAGDIEALDKIYGWASVWKPSDPSLTGVYELRKDELTAQGMETHADLGLNIFAKGLATGVAAVVKAAYANLSPIIDDFNEAVENYKVSYKTAMDAPGKFVEPTLPDELKVKEQLEAVTASGEFGLNAAVAFSLGHFLSPVLSVSTAPLWEAMGQQSWKKLPVQLMDVQRLINLIHRFPLESEVTITAPSGMIVGEPVYATEEQHRRWMDNLSKHGLSDDTIQDFKDEYKFYPTPNDLVTWVAKEVFENDAIEKYKLLDEVENIDRTLFHRAGVSDEQIDNFWKAHWQHPSFIQITEMLHRGLLPAGGLSPEWSNYDSITAWEKEMEKEVFEWFRLVEIPPYWRDKLIAMSYKVPTRVDVRRWWDLKTITEPRLRELYHNMGYHGKDLEDYVLWTKIYVLSKDLRARYSKGYLTKKGVSTELTTAGMDATRVTEWTKAIVKATGDERIKKEKDLTKAEICKGVKKGVITRTVGRGYLEKLGYDEWEAKFILNINVEHLTGSPETNWEFEELVNEYQNAMGAHHKEVPRVLIELEKEYRSDPRNKELEKEYRQAMKDYYEV